MSQTLNNKIVRVDNAISTLKTNLHLPADAPINIRTTRMVLEKDGHKSKSVVA